MLTGPKAVFPLALGRAALCRRLASGCTTTSAAMPLAAPTANGRQGASFFHDAGIFDDRKYRGEPEAVSNKPQVAVKSMRHHKTLDFFLSLEKLRVK